MRSSTPLSLRPDRACASSPLSLHRLCDRPRSPARVDIHRRYEWFTGPSLDRAVDSWFRPASLRSRSTSASTDLPCASWPVRALSGAPSTKNRAATRRSSYNCLRASPDSFRATERVQQHLRRADRTLDLFRDLHGRAAIANGREQVQFQRGKDGAACHESRESYSVMSSGKTPAASLPFTIA